MEYHYKVLYKQNNSLKEKLYGNVKDISIDFNINRDLIRNIYMKVPKALHPIIVSIERLPVPLKKEQKILIDFS
mgnify:FL=1|tara:strand:+ start:298 stop:519 length:222 start_codon:yes stop_codon:yes gene_type:complete